MLLDDRIIERTQAFYTWELRGRGWARYPSPVVLEPPFVEFSGHQALQATPRDDARRHTWLSSLVERLKDQPEAESQELEVVEPTPAPSSREGEIKELLLSLPEDTRVSTATLLGWLQSLATVSAPLGFEFLGDGHSVEMRLAVGSAEATHVVGQLKAAFPTLVITEAHEVLEERWREAGGSRFAAVEFGLASEFMVPLATGKLGDEPLLQIIAALANVADGELGLYQVLFEQTRARWSESVLRSVVTPQGEPFFADAPEITTLAREKVSSPLFAVVLRVAGVAGSDDRALDIARRLAGGLSQFGGAEANELMPLFAEDLGILEEDLLERTTHRSGMLLSAHELAALIRFPGSGVQVPELRRATERTKRAPAEVLDGGCRLGENEHEGKSVAVSLPAGVKTKHVHVVGASGTGKSTLLVRMILEDIEAGHGVGVLDPHGDLVDEVLSRIPDARLSDVVVFDPSDTEAVVGWNILGAETETEKDLLASDLVGVFRRLSTSWGDQMTAVLANAIMVFLESESGGTLVDLRRFLIEEDFRSEILATVADPHVTSFWETEFPLLIGKRPQAPILTRLDTFLRSRLVRNVVTVRKPKLDFREVTDDGLIFLGKLAAGAIGEENAALLGSLLVSKIHQVTLARSRQEAGERRPFFLYIDEFHHVATPSMASLFSGVRKYGLGLTVAHQDLHQLHASVPEVERSLLANAYTRVCFRVGEADARQLEKGFAYFGSDDLMGLGTGEAICRAGSRAADFNIRTQRLQSLDPAEAARRREAIRDLSRGRWAVALTEEPRETREKPATATDPAREQRTPRLGTGAVASDDVIGEEDVQEKPLRPQLDKALLDYLQSVAEEPFLSVRERNRRFGLSGWKGQQAKANLLDQDLVREVAVNPGGRGKRFILLELTANGRDVLAAYNVPLPSGHGRGGIAHQWWAQTIKRWLEDLGLSAQVEDETEGARVDVAFAAGSRKIAVEIEMGIDHVVENVRKDLAAGFDAVVSLLDNPRRLDDLRARLSEEFGQPPPGVRLGDLQDFEAILEDTLHPHPPPLGGPNQNEEPRPTKKRRRRRPLRQSDLERDRSALLSEPGAFSTPLAAKYLGLSPATLEALRSRGGGPVFLKLGRRVVYRREDLDEWLADRRHTSTSDPGKGEQ